MDRALGHRPQRGHEPARVGDRHERVALAVQDQERGRLGVHAVDRRGGAEALRLVIESRLEHVPLEHPLDQLRVVDALRVGEVVEAVEGHGGGDRGVGVLEAGLEVGVAGA